MAELACDIEKLASGFCGHRNGFDPGVEGRTGNRCQDAVIKDSEGGDIVADLVCHVEKLSGWVYRHINRIAAYRERRTFDSP